ncbi:hypothetical protein PENSPDRAFT_116280 [Peniophora sp. CONT]|nr:hypothetical protein PENSPDRAFT_116280 [Peniophora sp. CONT]
MFIRSMCALGYRGRVHQSLGSHHYPTSFHYLLTLRAGFFICMQIFVAMFTTVYIFKRPNYQVDGGKAFVTIGTPSSSPPPPDRVMGWIISFIMWSHATFATPEQKKRDAEYNMKKQKLIDEVLAKKYEYAVVSILVADPSVHGKGYGRALMQAVCARADARQEKTWLTSTNAKNRKFYEASGFKTIGELTLGEGNPVWHAPPPRIDIMLRLPGPLPKDVTH